jgi:anti-anti-sigma factor
MASSGLVISKMLGVTVANFRDSSILNGVAVEAIGKELYVLVDEQACRKIILDVDTVQFLSSSMIGVLILLHKKSQAIKGRVVICGLKPKLKDIFKVMRLDKVLDFADTEKDALKLLGVEITP